MPTYSYRCRACGNEFDVQQAFSDDPLTVCESCGGELRKLFNSVGIVFKGSGFYRNDSRSRSSGLTAKESSGSAESSSDSSSSSSSTSSPSTAQQTSTSGSTAAPAAAS